MDKYFKNLILCGDTDYYCLICNEHFQNLADIEKHIRWENHRKLLKNLNCIPKFQKDFIYKIKNAFYCQICNFLLSSLPEVTTHINLDTHLVNKRNPNGMNAVERIKCRYDSGFVIISDYIVSDEQWHCILKDRCLLCRVNVINIKEHIKLVGHILKIINAKINCRSENDYYRKIDDEYFYCFVCKNIVTYATIDNHWTENVHCSNRTTSIHRITATTSNDNEDKKKEFVKKLIESQREHYNIDLVSNAATCKECKLKVFLDFKTMLMHQKSHGGSSRENRSKSITERVCDSSDEEEPMETVYEEVTDHGKRRSELAAYGKQNFIKLNSGGGRGYCALCHVTLSASIKLFKEHVKGVRHRGYLELRGIKKCREHSVPSAKSKSLMDYLQTIYYSQSLKVLWINKTICVEVPSFVLISKTLIDPHWNKTKCFACDELYPAGEDEKHYKTEEHKKIFLAVKVLVIKNEFIREIRRDIFHCGICNKMYPFWEQMERHINSHDHLYNKKHAVFSQQIVQQWYTKNIPGKSSGHPDVLYVQLMGLGIFD